MRTPTLAIEVTDLTREFTPRKSAQVRALDKISLAIAPGEVHGLLGPNGAGKTTLVRILATILLPTAGRAAIHGHDVVTDARAVRPLIGAVFGGDRGLYTRLTARQNLEYWAGLYRVPSRSVADRVDRLLAQVGLADRADQRVETYSRGMRQRVHLARGLVADALVLFLDEPTSGMDPVAARRFRELIATVRGEGRTIVLATHDMGEAEALCDRVTLIDHGRIIATAAPGSLGDALSSTRRIDAAGVSPGLLPVLRATRSVVGVTGDGELIRITVRTEPALLEVLRILVDAGITAITTSRPSLEEAYLELVGNRGLAV